LVPRQEIIFEFKKRMPIKLLSEDLPTEFEMILYYVKNLNFEEEPNYELIKDLFKRIINNNLIKCEEGEYKYIWGKN